MDKRIQIIFGKTGTGKTTFVKNLIKNENRLIIIDSLSEYEGVVCEDFESFYEYINSKETFQICCRFRNDIDIEYVFKIINVLKNIVLVVEEAEIYINPKAQSSNFLYLCKYGRHTNISIVAVARRGAELSTNLKALCNRIISFNQTLPIDLKFMNEIGLNDLDKLKQFDYKIIDY